MAHLAAGNEHDKIPPLLTPDEAFDMVNTSALLQRQSEIQRKNVILSEPASEVFENYGPGHDIVLRRVAPQPWMRPARPPRAELQTAEMFFNTREIRYINLSITVFDHEASELVWRQDGETYTAISNVDFNHLAPLGGFEQDEISWRFFCFVANIDSESAREFNRLARLAGYEGDPRTKPDISMLNANAPDYAVYADDPDAIADALIEALDAIHSHYAANREQLEVQWKNTQTLQKARRAWHEANPPEPRETLINFWIRP